MKIHRLSQLNLIKICMQSVFKSVHVIETNEDISWNRFLTDYVESDRVSIQLENKINSVICLHRPTLIDHDIITFRFIIHDFKPLDRKKYRRRKKVRTTTFTIDIPTKLYEKVINENSI